MEAAAAGQDVIRPEAERSTAWGQRLDGVGCCAVVVAGPRMLGELRKHDSPLRREGLQLDEIERDLAWQSNAQLHDHLAQMGVIPPRQRMAAAR